MNNKKIGTEFERQVLEWVAAHGYWVHFLSPNEQGAQPFDIIAVKNNTAVAIECKTLTPDKRYFSIDRLEPNQIMAFEKWMQNGNASPLIYVKHGDAVRIIEYKDLKKAGKIDMRGITNDDSDSK